MNININNQNPARALPRLTIGARCALRVYIWSVEEDFEEVFLALKRGDYHFRAYARIAPSGVWTADIAPELVPEPTQSVYEVFARRGDALVMLGRGALNVIKPVTDTTAVDASPLPGTTPVWDDDGAQHTLKAVRLDNGEWTLQVD
jgi:hypothetical protein